MTTTATATYTPFAAAQEDARELPKLNCLGFISSVGEAKISASGTYVVQPLTIEPVQAGKKAFVNFLYRPEWLRPGFDPNSLKAEDGGNSLFTVYKMHIAGSNQLSTLAGIAGSEENFNQLAARIQAAIEGVENDAVPAAVQAAIQEFVNDAAAEVGYYSVQKREATGNLNANGTKEKRAVAGQREVGGYFWPTEANHKRNTADAAKGKSVMAYDLG